jgi:3D (Asp-Asp-Asp) domain-containing protein
MLLAIWDISLYTHHMETRYTNRAGLLQVYAISVTVVLSLCNISVKSYAAGFEAIPLGTLTVTSYQPIPAQTDNSPTWTSIGDRTTKFGAAVSQDMLKDGRVKYGDVLYIPTLGYRVVNDCMNARHKNAVDLLVFTHKEEKAVGVRHIRVYKIGGLQ